MLVCTIGWEPLIQSLKLDSDIPLVIFITWLDFGEIMQELFVANFLLKIRMILFKVKHSNGHSSSMVGAIDMKRKGGASVGYWVNYVTLSFDFTHNLDFRLFKVNFQKSWIAEIVILLMWKKNQANQILGWLYVFALSQNTWSWPWNCKVNVWKSLILVIRGLIDMERKGCELIIHDHDPDFWVTKVGWVDVLDSEGGNLRRRRAVDTSG